MLNFFNDSSKIYFTLPIIIFGIFILYFATIKFINNRKIDKLKITLLKLYYDKLFIIKLIQLVKENLTLESQVKGIISELMVYFNLTKAILYKNNNLLGNSTTQKCELTPIDTEDYFNDFNINQYVEEKKEKIFQNFDKRKFLIFRGEEGQDKKYIIFPLMNKVYFMDKIKLVGALVVEQNVQIQFDSSELDTLNFICDLMEYILMQEIKPLVVNDSYQLNLT